LAQVPAFALNQRVLAMLHGMDSELVEAGAFFFEPLLAYIPNFHYIGIMDTKDIIAALSALAQDSRLAVFRLLVQVGPQGMAATQIAEQLALPPSSLSFHLKELMHANMVIQRKAGRSLIYSANFETMNQVLGFLTENCCGGNVCSPVSMSDCANPGACS
jgi:ArsR family transcriptional regulator, arsenate/arsenite/antimonite-responsive transcriptional repressor